jgi:hypothetical protein
MWTVYVSGITFFRTYPLLIFVVCCLFTVCEGKLKHWNRVFLWRNALNTSESWVCSECPKWKKAVVVFFVLLYLHFLSEMCRCVALLLKCFVITVLRGNADVSVSLARSYVYYGDGEEYSGCFSRKRKAKTRAQRRYSLDEPPVNVNRERWNQSGFDARPVTPPLPENRRDPDEMKTLPSVGRRRRSSLGSFCLK